MITWMPFGTVILLQINYVFCGVFEFPRYGYVYPQPPVQFDEISTPDYSYLPPSVPPLQDELPLHPVGPTYLPPIYPPLGVPANDIQPPIEDDTVIVSAPPTNQYLPPLPNLRILNMSCLDSTQFYALMKSVRPLETSPILENSQTDCIQSVSSDTFRINLEGNKVNECGVRKCSTKALKMCVTLRMATVKGLKLPEDGLITLQCTPQQTIAAHTKHLRINPQAIQGRSAGRNVAVASGGTQRKFDLHVNLLRKSKGSGDFDQQVQPGSAVNLGEDLILKVSVKEGDGWRFSKMGSVVLRSIATQKSAMLVDQGGCRVPAMHSICPEQPKQVENLVTLFPFRAFLFQGPSSGDDMILSVSMLACVHSQECTWQAKSCDDFQRTSKLSRSKRDLKNQANVTTNFESELNFRVVSPAKIPEGDQFELKFNPNMFSTHPLVPMSIILCICFVIGILFMVKRMFKFK